MRKIALCVAFIFLASGCFSQTPSKPALPKMGDQFITLALKSLRLIGQYDGWPEGEKSGVVVTDHALVEAINGMNDAARSKAELEAIDTLKSFLADRIYNNASKVTLIHLSWKLWLDLHPEVEEHAPWTVSASAADRYLEMERPVVLLMKDREQACSDALGPVLRSGRLMHPSACTRVKVSISGEVDRLYKLDAGT